MVRRRQIRSRAAKRAHMKPIFSLASAKNDSRRINIHNMPKDANEQSVKLFLEKRVGAVKLVERCFDSNNKPTGSFSVTFAVDGHAVLALNMLHDAPIDNGKSKPLKIEVIHKSFPVGTDLDVRIGTSPRMLQNRIGKVPLSARIGNKPMLNQSQKTMLNQSQRTMPSQSQKALLNRSQKTMQRSTRSIQVAQADRSEVLRIDLEAISKLS